jgi:hypothetical protein
MFVAFLTAQQVQQYSRYQGEPSDAQLARYFLLSTNDLELHRTKYYGLRKYFEAAMLARRLRRVNLGALKARPLKGVGSFRHRAPDRASRPLPWWCGL